MYVVCRLHLACVFLFSLIPSHSLSLPLSLSPSLPPSLFLCLSYCFLPSAGAVGFMEGLGGVRGVRGPLLLPCMSCVGCISLDVLCLFVLTDPFSLSLSPFPSRPLSLPVFLFFFVFAVRQ